MLTVLISVLSFFVAIGILVGIHEFGHFWVARKLGIKVIRFAIGFGKPLWTYKSNDKDGTEYVLAAIPMGGYVKMLDEREGDVDPAEKHRAFNTQPVWKRFLVVLAGPMFNFFFAIAAFAAIQMLGIDSIRPLVGNVTQSSYAANAGFEPKDKIVAINDVETESMSQVRLTLLNEYLKDPKLAIHVETESGAQAVRNMDLNGLALLADEGDYLAKTGLNFWQPSHATLIHQVLPGKAAEAAGVKAKDKLVTVDGKPVASTEFFSNYINAHAGKSVELVIDREGTQMTLQMTPKLTEIDGKTRGLIGVSLARKYDDNAMAEIDKMRFTRQAPFLESMQIGLQNTWDMSVMTLKVMGRLITGEASLKNLSGPITIADYAGKSANHGLTAFLGFLAIISLSLGVLNLLPIPMLDGGHLMYYVIEVIKGSPVSEKFEAMGMRVGMSLVGVMMVIAIYNDIGRLIN